MIAIYLAVCDIKELDLGVHMEHFLQETEVLWPDVIFREVQVEKPIEVGESQAKMLKAEAVVEQLLEAEVSQLILVLHFDLYYL